MESLDPQDEPRSLKKKPPRAWLVLLVIAALPFLPLVLLAYLIIDLSLRFRFLISAAFQRKFVLFVYSDSPIWKSHLETEILPRIQEHALVLNWSVRKDWPKLAWTVQAFHHWGGQKEFNPLAIVFIHFFKVKVIRFYRPFLDFKHGKMQPLQRIEAQLFEWIKAKAASV
jgi:hypothetical protein